MLKLKTLKQHLDKLNKKDRFSNEREHLIYTYSIDPLLVNDVISNLTSTYNLQMMIYQNMLTCQIFITNKKCQSALKSLKKSWFMMGLRIFQK
jgi:hypothetical protein